MNLEQRQQRDAELLELHREQLVRHVRSSKRLAKVRDPRRRKLANIKRKARSFERAERRALSARPRGHNLPAWLLHNRREHVVADDLDELVPDAWYVAHAAECRQLGRRAALPPRAIALLELLAWVHGFRGGALGCGLQAPVGWIARKLRCSRSYVYKLLRLLDDRELVQHFRQLRRYVNLSRQLEDAQYTGPDGELHPFKRWRDAGGTTREFVDVHSVTYATPAGVALVLRRRAIANRKRWQRAGRPVRRNAAYADLCQRLAPLYTRLRMRLAPAPKQEETPYEVDLACTDVFIGPASRVPRSQDPPGPER